MLIKTVALVLLLCLSVSGETWRYTFEKPRDDWYKASYDDATWKTGQSPFGKAGTPGMKVQTPWLTPAIWMRRTFELSSKEKAPKALRIIHDEDAVVYINGVEVCSLKGHIKAYKNIPLSSEVQKACVQGKNTIAVSCIQTVGGQGIDVLLSTESPKPEEPATASSAQPVVTATSPETITFIEQLTGKTLTKDDLKKSLDMLMLVEKQDELLADWLRQDCSDMFAEPLFKGGTVAANFREAIAKALESTRALCGGEWVSAKIPEGNDVPTLVAFYRKVCLARRAKRLEALSHKMPTWVYARHFVMGGSHYAYTEALSDAQAERNFDAGGQVCLMEMQPDGLWKETVLLETKDGIIRDVDVDFDAKKIMFSWKKSDRGDDYHLYEMDVGTDGRPRPESVRQLTAGTAVADYEGCYLPDGSIIFNSTRCMQIVDCWWTEVSNLYRCDADGKNILRLGFDQVHVNYPAMTWDNRVLYTRWEYNDRSQMYPQPLFQMMPDGTSQSAVYGENSWFPTTIAHARTIPGSPDMFAIATGHHTLQVGDLILLEPGKGRQETEGLTLVAPVREPPTQRPIVIDRYGQDKDLHAYPYPLDSKQVMVTYNPTGWNVKGAAKEKKPARNRKTGFGLYWMDIQGNREVLASRLGLSCGRAVPLMARQRPPTRPSQVDYKKTDGTFYIQDVYVGEPMKDVPRGTVKTLRVVELEYRSSGIGRNGNKGPGGGALVSTPVSIGNGAWDPKALIGDAKIYEDGSVFFKTDARRPVYFMLLDEKGRMVQTMRSWTTLQSGENASCVGCHEPKNSVPLASAKPTQALAAGAQALAPIQGPRRGFSFVAEVQPILDQHCVKCHNANHPKKFDLRNELVKDTGAKRAWTQAYLTLTHATPDQKSEKIQWRGDPTNALLNWISAASAPTIQPPYSAGSNKSGLFAKLDAGHCKTISATEIARLAIWVDLGVPFCKDYVEGNLWNEQEMQKYQTYRAKRDRADALDAETLKILANRKR